MRKQQSILPIDRRLAHTPLAGFGLRRLLVSTAAVPKRRGESPVPGDLSLLLFVKRDGANCQCR
jgi:hypothetical protein